MIRENWRIISLVILITLSALLIFVPGLGLGGETEGPTNLQYGLDLSGGARIQAPLVGQTAEGADLTGREPNTVADEIASNIPGATRSDVRVNAGDGTVEVFVDVDRGTVEDALAEADIPYDRIRQGVSERTRESTVATLERKIDASGLAGGIVYQSNTPTGEHFIVIEVPNTNPREVRELIAQRGVIEIVARFPGEENGSTVVRNETVLTQDNIATVGTVEDPNTQIPTPYVPVTLTDEGAVKFASAMEDYGFTRGGTDACREEIPAEDRYCIDTVLDGQVVYSASLSSGLAANIERGDFVESQNFVITAGNRSQARSLQINLRAGALPAELDLNAGTTSFISPALAENFKLYSLITGIIAVFAVAGMVFIRYGRPTVAAPMIVTALSEVVILLGFAAGVGLALDLSHIAGFIAVIGTGVDDLIIIADEVMAEGSVSSDRVFRSRFRKAFWIIGAAGITTVIAMGPLAYLQLGDLRGFAIVTIIGVFIGVLITRPAYGDILRNLYT